MKRELLAFTLALVAGTTLAATEVYRWVDKDGKVIYGSQPPAGVVYERMPPPRGPASGGAADGPAAAPTTGASNDAVDQEMKALLAQRCTAAKAVAARYEKAPYLQLKAADGSLQRMAPEDEARERLRIKDEVATACGAQ